MVNFDLKRLIIGSVAGLVISLVIGLVIFWLTLGSVKLYDAGVYSTGFTEFSFVVGVVIAAALFGSMERDIVSAGIVGFIIGLLTCLIEGFVLSLFFAPMTVQIITGWWGSQTILIFAGVIVAVIFNRIFSKKSN